jgi:glucan phosphoethanolaminetransferase (alkaline phosphatase superfamily)
MDRIETAVCACYDIKWYDFIVPTNYIFYKICYRSDKVKLFLITLIRIITLIGIMSLLYANNYIAYRSNFMSKKLWLSFLILYLILNIISLSMVVLKNNVYDEKLIDQEVEEILDEKLKKYKIKVTDDLGYQLL